MPPSYPATCPLCEASRFSLAIIAPDRRFTDHMDDASVYSVWRCEQCGGGVTFSPLSSKDRKAAYPADYEPFVQVSQSGTELRKSLTSGLLRSIGYPMPGTWRIPAWLARILIGIRSWTWYPPPPPPGRLLDVGCGSGSYGASLLRLGWQVDGVEPDIQAVERARLAGLRVFASDSMETELSAGSYDVITLWHVLEHMDDPVAVLRHLRPALKGRGQLIVECPNWSSLGARLCRSYWFHLDLPRHRVHFSPDNLCQAIECAGFAVQRVQYIPNPHGLAGAIAYRWGRQLRWNPLVQGIAWVFGILTAIFHSADVIRVSAETRDSGGQQGP